MCLAELLAQLLRPVYGQAVVCPVPWVKAYDIVVAFHIFPFLVFLIAEIGSHTGNGEILSPAVKERNAVIRRGAAWLVSVNIAITAACPAHLCSPLRTETENAKRSFGFFITTTVGKPGLGKMDAKKVAGFQKISAAHGSSLFSFCFHSKGGATAF